jgi:flagellar biosynthetic protein FliR
MTATLEQTGFAAFLLFCRIGGCVMFAPAMASPRIPVQFRVLLAAALSLSLSTFLYTEIGPRIAAMDAESKLGSVVTETATGAFIGMMARLFTLAVQFAATAAAAAIGLAGIPGVPIDDAEAGSPLSALAGLAATAVVVALDLHVELVMALVESYRVLPVGAPWPVEWSMASATRTLSETTILALRLASPFLAFALVANMAIGLANKFSPQIAVYYTTTGLVIIAGLALFWLAAPDWFSVLAESYGAWLRQGGY